MNRAANRDGGTQDLKAFKLFRLILSQCFIYKISDFGISA